VWARSASVWLAVLLVVATTWAKISTDFDHNVDFGNYKTYSWGKLETDSSFWDERVKSAIDNQLAAKGWRPVSSGGDVIVNAFGKTHSEHTIDTFYEGEAWLWRGFGNFATSTMTVDTYKVGTLVVDMFDPHTKNLIWRGVASDTLFSNPEKNTRKLDGEVRKMLLHFPPNLSR